MRQDELRSQLLSLLPSGSSVTKLTQLSELWAGYGHIYRVHLDLPQDRALNESDSTWIVKTIRPPARQVEMSTTRGHARKMLSYKVEANFYRDFAPTFMSEERGCYVPRLLASFGHKRREKRHRRSYLKICQHGFPYSPREGHTKRSQVDKALEWLATFHAASWDIESHFETSPSAHLLQQPSKESAGRG